MRNTLRRRSGARLFATIVSLGMLGAAAPIAGRGKLAGIPRNVLALGLAFVLLIGGFALPVSVPPTSPAAAPSANAQSGWVGPALPGAPLQVCTTNFRAINHEIKGSNWLNFQFRTDRRAYELTLEFDTNHIGGNIHTDPGSIKTDSFVDEQGQKLKDVARRINNSVYPPQVTFYRTSGFSFPAGSYYFGWAYFDNRIPVTLQSDRPTESNVVREVSNGDCVEVPAPSVVGECGAEKTINIPEVRAPEAYAGGPAEKVEFTQTRVGDTVTVQAKSAPGYRLFGAPTMWRLDVSEASCPKPAESLDDSATGDSSAGPSHPLAPAGPQWLGIIARTEVKKYQDNLWFRNTEVPVTPPGGSTTLSVAKKDSPSPVDGKPESGDFLKFSKSVAEGYVIKKTGGDNVTYRYVAENRTDAVDGRAERLYFNRIADNKCTNLVLKSDFHQDEWGGNYLKPGESAVWECTQRITTKTTNLAEVLFTAVTEDARPTSENTLQANAQAAATVIVSPTGNSEPIGNADLTCSAIDYTTADRTGTGGRFGSISLAAPEIPSSHTIPGGFTASTAATSAQEPEYIYYSAVRPTGNRPRTNEPTYAYAGLYRVRKDGNMNRKVGEDHEALHSFRLTFDAAGNLWSFAFDGFLYKLGRENIAANNYGAWENRGMVGGNGSTIATVKDPNTKKNIFFNSDWIYGDMAFDGADNLWFTASRAYGDDTNVGTTYLMMIPKGSITAGKHEPVIISELVAKGRYAGQKGFHGLAFGQDGKLYVSFDGDKDGFGTDPDGVGALYRYDIASGDFSLIATSSTLYRTQDLSSCAFPNFEVVSTKQVERVAQPEKGYGESSWRLHDVYRYTITVENKGQLPATGIYVKDPLSSISLERQRHAGYVPGSAKLNGEKVVDGAEENFPYEESRRINSPKAPEGQVNPGEKAVVSFLVTVPKTQNGQVCNQADIEVGAEGANNTRQILLKTDDPTQPGNQDATCFFPPRIDFKKVSGGAAKPIGDNKYEAAYVVSVENTGIVPTTFDKFTDQPEFPINNGEFQGSVRIEKLEWSEGDQPSAARAQVPDKGNGLGYEIAPANGAEIPLGVGEVKKYTITVTFTLIAGSQPLELCKETGSGHRLQNRVTATRDSDPNNNIACDEPPSVEPKPVSLIKKSDLGPNIDLSGVDFKLVRVTSDNLVRRTEIDLSSPLKLTKGGTNTEPKFTSDPLELTTDATKPVWYAFVETQAPAKHSLMPMPIFFYVTKDGAVVPSLRSATGKDVYLSAEDKAPVDPKSHHWAVNFGQAVGTSAVVQKGSVGEATFTIAATDYSVETLPRTGGRGIWLWALAGALLIGAAAYIARRRA